MKNYFKLTNLIWCAVLCTILGSIYMLHQLEALQKNTQFIQDKHEPYRQKLDEFDRLLTQAGWLTTSLIYMPEKTENRQVLQEILYQKYPNLRSQLTDYMSDIENTSTKNQIDDIFSETDNWMLGLTEIHQKFKTQADYQDLIKLFGAEAILKHKILPQQAKIHQHLRKIIAQKSAQSQAFAGMSIEVLHHLRWAIWFTGFSLILLMASGGFYLVRQRN